MTGSQASARGGYRKNRKIEQMREIFQEVCGSNEKENQTIAMIRGGSYIDQEQAGQAIDSYTDFRHPPFRREVGKK